MRSFVFAVLVILTFANGDNLISKLKKTNGALRQVLKSLSTDQERAVAEKSRAARDSVVANAANCGKLVAYNACQGGQAAQEVEHYSRVEWGSDQSGWFNGVKSIEVCQQKCHNFGVPGCCEYQNDHDKCYFTPLLMSTTPDSNYDKVYIKRTRETYNMPKREASICTIPGCAYDMFLMNDVVHEKVIQMTSECGWDRFDKVGRKSLNGGGHTRKECDDFCMNTPTCMFASLSSSGYCHTFQTCTVRGDGGWITKQKVCKGHDEELKIVFPWE